METASWARKPDAPCRRPIQSRRRRLIPGFILVNILLILHISMTHRSSIGHHTPTRNYAQSFHQARNIRQ